jgi:hypothetical protein
MPKAGPAAQTKKPCADPHKLGGIERRARFSYDDLLELFRFMEFYENVSIAARSKK